MLAVRGLKQPCFQFLVAGGVCTSGAAGGGSEVAPALWS